MIRMLTAVAITLALAACSSGEPDPETVPSAGAMATATDGGEPDAAGDDAPAPDVTVGPYDQVEIAPFWRSSLGDTEIDDGGAAGALASLDFAGALPDGTVAMLVPLYVHNGSREDIDVRDAVEPTFVTASGDEYGAEASCGTFIGSYDLCWFTRATRHTPKSIYLG